jgi:hypothetical protein
MRRHLIIAAGIAPFVLLVASPSRAGHSPQSLQVKNIDRAQRKAANTEASRRAAIAELCPDDTLSTGQRNCERMARRAADAESTESKPNRY